MLISPFGWGKKAKGKHAIFLNSIRYFLKPLSNTYETTDQIIQPYLFSIINRCWYDQLQKEECKT